MDEVQEGSGHDNESTPAVGGRQLGKAEEERRHHTMVACQNSKAARCITAHKGSRSIDALILRRTLQMNDELIHDRASLIEPRM